MVLHLVPRSKLLEAAAERADLIMIRMRLLHMPLHVVQVVAQFTAALNQTLVHVYAVLIVVVADQLVHVRIAVMASATLVHEFVPQYHGLGTRRVAV